MNRFQVRLILFLGLSLTAISKNAESASPNYFPIDSSTTWSYKVIHIDRKGRIDASNKYVEDTTLDSSIQIVRNMKKDSEAKLIRNVDSIWIDSEKHLLDTCIIRGSGWNCKDIYIVSDSLQSNCTDPHVCTSVKRVEVSGKMFYRYYTFYYGPSDDGSLLEIFEEDVGLIYYVKTTGINVYSHYIRDEMKLFKFNQNTLNRDSIIYDMVNDPVEIISSNKRKIRNEKFQDGNFIHWKGRSLNFLGKVMEKREHGKLIQ